MDDPVYEDLLRRLLEAEKLAERSYRRAFEAHVRARELRQQLAEYLAERAGVRVGTVVTLRGARGFPAQPWLVERFYLWVGDDESVACYVIVRHAHRPNQYIARTVLLEDVVPIQLTFDDLEGDDESG